MKLRQLVNRASGMALMALLVVTETGPTFASDSEKLYGIMSDGVSTTSTFAEVSTTNGQVTPIFSFTLPYYLSALAYDQNTGKFVALGQIGIGPPYLGMVVEIDAVTQTIEEHVISGLPVSPFTNFVGMEFDPTLYDSVQTACDHVLVTYGQDTNSNLQNRIAAVNSSSGAVFDYTEPPLAVTDADIIVFNPATSQLIDADTNNPPFEAISNVFGAAPGITTYANPYNDAELYDSACAFDGTMYFSRRATLDLWKLDAAGTGYTRIGPHLFTPGAWAFGLAVGPALNKLVPVCGNGTQDAGELCDDGNTNDGDGCSSCCTPLLACVPPPPDMVAWWALDEETGTTAADSALANDGTHVNEPTPVAGKVDVALNFDGIDDHVVVPDDPTLNFGTGDLSIDAWIRTSDSVGIKSIQDKRTFSPTRGYSLFLVNGLLSFQLADAGGAGDFCGSSPTSPCRNYVSAAFVATGEWVHVAVTVDRDQVDGLRFYVNGGVVGAFDATTKQDSLDNTAVLYLARHSNDPGAYFEGTLDEVELFSRVLDPAEVLALYLADAEGKCKAGCPGPCDDTDPCTADHCDEGTGSCVFTPITSACCVDGQPRVCDDDNICTDDSCDPETGCVYADNTNPCDDGDACTTGDTCDDGDCDPGDPTNCDDGNCCTIDDCNPATGCFHSANTAPPVFVNQPSLGACPMLWPPQHGYVDFTFASTGATATSTCGIASIGFGSCYSSQPDNANGVGDGNSTRDCVYTPGTLSLRAERDGACSPLGRVYTSTAVATDVCGNTATSGSFDVYVWHDRGHGPSIPYLSANPGSNQNDTRAGLTGTWGPGCGPGIPASCDVVGQSHDGSDADPEMEIFQNASISVDNLAIARASGGNVKLTWTEPAHVPGINVTRFHVYRLDPVTLFWTQIAEVTKQTTSYQDPVLNDGRSWQYKVTAVIK